MAIHIRYIETHRTGKQNQGDYSDGRVSSWREYQSQHNERHKQNKGKEIQTLPDALANGDDGVQIQARCWGAQQKRQRQNNKFRGNKLNIQPQIGFCFLEQLFCRGAFEKNELKSNTVPLKGFDEPANGLPPRWLSW